MKLDQLAWILGAIIALLSGCTTNGSRTQQRYAAADDVHPQRAFLPLHKIEPVVRKPQKGDKIEPLSQRGQRQIQKADRQVKDARYTEAAIELERALRYDPKHPDIHRALAMLHWEAGNVVRAKTHAMTAIESRPDDPTAHYVLGRAFLTTDDPAAAMIAFRSAILCPDFAEDQQIAVLCHFYLAEALEEDGYLQAAVDQYGRAQSMVESTRIESGRTEFEALRQSGCRNLRTARADLLERLGQFAKAADVLSPIVEASPDDVEIGCRYSRLLMQAGRLGAALTAARRLPLSEKVVFELLYKIHDSTGHGERVVDDLRREITEHPDDSRLVLYLADMFSRLGSGGDAVLELRRYLEAYPDNEEVRSVLFGTLVKQSSWAEAVAVCAQGIDRDPTQAANLEKVLLDVRVDGAGIDQLLSPSPKSVSPTNAYLRGVLATKSNRLEAANDWLQSAFARRPNSTPIRVALARLLLRLYHYDDAIKVGGVDDDSVQRDARLEFVLGQVYERLDKVDHAVRHFQAAVQLDRSNTDAALELAALYRRTEKTLQGRRQLSVLIEEHPEHEAAREMMIALHLEEGRVDVAVEQLTELQEKATTPLVKARCTAFLDHIKDKNLDAYRKTLVDAMEQHGADADTWIAVAQSYNEPLKNAKDKRLALERALAIDADREEALLGMVGVSRSLLDFDSATAYLKKLLVRRPNRHEWRLGYNEPRRGSSASSRWYGLIELFWVIQDFDAALKVIDQGMNSDHSDDRKLAGYRRMKVETLRLAGRKDEALHQLEQWVDANKDDEVLSLLLANEYVRQDKAERAIPMMEQRYKDSPSRRNLSIVVRTLIVAKHTDRASQHLLEWLDTDPENDGIVSLLADILTDKDTVGDGLDLVRNHLLRSINRERLQSLMITLLGRAERFDESLFLIESLLDEVITLLGGAAPLGLSQPQGVPTNEQLVRLPNRPFAATRLHDRLLELRVFQLNSLFASKDFRSARNLVLEWLDETRAADLRFKYLNYLSMFHRGEGDEESANKAQQRALVLRPDDITLNNDIAYAWIDQGTRLDEAEPMIRYALVSSPLQSSYLDTYGWLLYKKDQLAQAKTWLTRANVARGGEDPVILDHLGDTLWRLGEKPQAMESWQAALKASKDRPERAMISADEQRVIDTIDKKIKAARSGAKPRVAELASK